MLHDFNDFLHINIPSTLKTKTPRYRYNHQSCDDYNEIEEFEKFMTRNSKKNRHSRTHTADLCEYLLVLEQSAIDSKL